MTRGRVQFVALLLFAPLIVGCAGDSLRSSDVDCGGRIGWEGVVYRPHNELNQAAPRGERLGSGDVLDCDGSKVATVDVFAVDGVDLTLAIKVRGEWRGVYVAEGAPKSSWPDVLKAGLTAGNER
jgi:hypothetical protein